MNVGVALLGRRADRIHVAGLRELARWPMHGLVGAIAFRFDGRLLKLVRVISFNKPSRSARNRA